MSTEDEIRASLEAALSPTRLEIINESDQHAGHAGHDGSGDSHFRVRIAADVFKDMSRIARHRAVHAAMGKELVASIHALALEIEA